MQVSDWFVSTNDIAGMKMYQVVRKINEDEVDHSGNREVHGALFETQEEAQACCDMLNRKDI